MLFDLKPINYKHISAKRYLFPITQKSEFKTCLTLRISRMNPLIN